LDYIPEATAVLVQGSQDLLPQLLLAEVGPMEGARLYDGKENLADSLMLL
jgi:hypothetical protein